MIVSEIAKMPMLSVYPKSVRIPASKPMIIAGISLSNTATVNATQTTSAGFAPKISGSSPGVVHRIKVRISSIT